MDIPQVEVGGDFTFLQMHGSKVSETYFRLCSSFRFAVQFHFLGHEVREVRQVGVKVQRQIKQHIPHEVVYSAVSGKFGVFGFCRQIFDHYIRYFSFGKPYVRVGVESHITDRIR